LNCIHFGKVCFLQPWCFKVVVGCVCSKYTHSAPLSYHMFLPKKKPRMLQAAAFSTLLLVTVE
jgi:hypothetical protein